MGEKGWGLIVAEASSFGSALGSAVRGLMGDELVFAVILHSVQRSLSKTLSRSMAIVIPSLAKLNQDVHESHWNSTGTSAGGFSNLSRSSPGSFSKSALQRSVPSKWFRVPMMGDMSHWSQRQPK